MWEGLQAVRKEIQESVNTIHDNEEIHDGFQLRFVGKSYAKFVTGLPSETVLVPDNDWNNQENNKDSQNIFITGDNLDALKHLVNAYSGAIKMIYIDPPYNTGSDGFVYKDSFKFSDEDLKQKLGFSDTELARLRALDGKCSHSAWLTFMLPRLILAKRLLSDDGVIFISIDDNEYANLKMICDEVLGENNFVCHMSVNRTSEVATALTIQKSEYCLVYGKNVVNLNIVGNKKYSVSRGTVGNIDQTMPEIKFPAGLICKNVSDGIYEKTRILKGSLENIENLTPIIVKDGKLSEDVVLKARWRSSNDMRNFFQNQCKPTKAKINGVIEEIYFDGDRFMPYIKKLTTEKLSSLYLENKKGSMDLDRLGMAGLFDFPKSVNLVADFIKLFTKSGDIILDFFAGSATTAHAVMQLNKDDGDNRKYIMVQWDEAVKPGSEAENQGFKTIDEISRKRIKLAAEQIGDTSGFKHYKLAKVTDDLILDKIDEFDPTKPNLLSDDMVSPFSGNALGTGLNASGLDTLLTTWMVDDGYPINTKVEEFKFGNYVAYSPVGSRRLYLISDGWDSNATQDLLNKIGRNEISVQTIIIYNHSFNFTMLTELKNNLKHVLDDDKKIEIIERF